MRYNELLNEIAEMEDEQEAAEIGSEPETDPMDETPRIMFLRAGAVAKKRNKGKRKGGNAPGPDKKRIKKTAAEPLVPLQTVFSPPAKGKRPPTAISYQPLRFLPSYAREKGAGSFHS